jgi:hypothetical protein
VEAGRPVFEDVTDIYEAESNVLKKLIADVSGHSLK